MHFNRTQHALRAEAYVSVNSEFRTAFWDTCFGSGCKAEKLHQHWRIEIKLSPHFSCLVTSPPEFDIFIMCMSQCQESTLPTVFYRLQTMKFLWPVSVKYQKSTVEPAVSHLVPLFWPCRALTSLMKAGLPSCLFSPCLLTRRRALSSASQQQKTLQPTAQQ